MQTERRRDAAPEVVFVARPNCPATSFPARRIGNNAKELAFRAKPGPPSPPRKRTPRTGRPPASLRPLRRP